MELLQVIDLKGKDKDKLLDGSGVALVATTKDLTTRTGADQEIAHNPLDHIFPLEMTMQWIHPRLSVKQPMTKNAKNIERLVDASNAENKATSLAIVLTRNPVFARLVLSKFKMTMNL